MSEPDREPSTLPIAIALLGTALAVFPGGAADPERFRAPKVLLLAVGAALAAIAALRSGRGPSFARMDRGLAVYAGAAVLSLVLHSTNLLLGASAPAAELSAFVLLVWGREVSSTPAGRERLLAWIVVAAVAVAVIALAESAGAPLPWATRRHPSSTLGNRNFVGGYCAIALPVAIHFLASRPRLLSMLPVSVLGLTILLSRCRSAWLGLLVAAIAAGVLLAWRARTVRWLSSGAWVAGALALSFAAATLLPWRGLSWRESDPLGSTAARLFEHDEGSGRFRVRQYALGLEVVRRHPLLGVGPRGWDDAAAAHAHALADGHAEAWTTSPTPHSDLLRVATETGLLGLLGWCGAMFALAAAALRGLRRGSAGAGTIAVLGSLAVLLVHSTLDAPLFRPEGLALVAVLAATMGEAQPQHRRRRPWQLALASMAIVALAIGVLRFGAAAAAVGASDPLVADRAGQRWFARPEVSQRIARTLVAQDRCDEARGPLRESIAWSPHRWGAYELAARCADGEHAGPLRRQVLRLEPHGPQPGF